MQYKISLSQRKFGIKLTFTPKKRLIDCLSNNFLKKFKTEKVSKAWKPKPNIERKN